MRLFLLLLIATATLNAQQPIRIDVTRAQVDAIVTDKSGKLVTDLTADDFELFADAIRRPIDSATFLQSTTHSSVSQTSIPTRQRVDRTQVTRTIALLIDDLKMSPTSIYRTRLALHEFIDKQLSPGDLISIVSTSGGVSTLQQFTTDPRILHRAVDRIRFQMSSASAANTDNDSGETAYLIQRRFAVGAMSAIKFIAAGMRPMPGRKSIILFSDGFALSKTLSPKDPNVTVSEVRDVSDTANRSSVVIYAVDTRGLQTPPLQAQEDLQGLEPEQVAELLNKKRTTFTDNQQGLSFLALETGGATRFNSNDILDSVTSILQQQSGYYLITFTPNEAKPNYSRLLIRLKRPGLHIRYRKTALPDPIPAQSNLLTALASPFATRDIPLRLHPVIAPTEKSDKLWQLGALLHIDCSQIEFAPPNAQGQHTATIQILSITEGESPLRDATTQRAYTIRANSTELPRLKAEGLIYALQTVSAPPGPYQIRAAVIDANSRKIGAVSLFTEIPGASQSQPLLSTITLSDGTPKSQILRTFTSGKPLTYTFNLFHLDPAKSPYTLEPRIILDDKLIWRGKPIPVTTRSSGGSFTLGANSKPGEYTLQVLLMPTNKKLPTLSNWVDFELR